MSDPNDLTLLYEYLGRYADDQQVIVDLVRSRVEHIEEFLDALDQSDE